MGNLTVNQYTVATATIQGVSLSQVCGAYELCFVIAASVIGPTEGTSARWYVMHSARAQAAAHGRMVVLGLAIPDAPPLLLQHKNPYPAHIELKMLLQASQLSALEDLRNGGDIDFQFSVSGTGGVVGRARNVELYHETLHYKSPQSEWIKQLNAAKALNVLLFEIPMPFIDPSLPSKAISQHIKRAIKHFAEGNFGDCVAECRKATEQLPVRSRADMDKSLKQNWNDMSKDDREAALAFMVKHYTQLPHHSASQGGTDDYTRSDAKLALTLVAAFASLYSQRLTNRLP